MHNYKYSQSNIMHLDFADLASLCCPNTLQKDQQRHQENAMQRYLSPKMNRPEEKPSTPIRPPVICGVPVNQGRVGTLAVGWEARSPGRIKTVGSSPRPQTLTILNPMVKEAVSYRQLPTIRLFPSAQPLPLSPRTLNLTQPLPQMGLRQPNPNTTQQPIQGSPRISFTIKNRQIQPARQEKRLRTQEQQTEYSSKHSQILFKNCGNNTENQQFPSLVTFKKHNSIFFENSVIFQEQNQSMDNNQSINCNEEPPKQHIECFNDSGNNQRTNESIMAQTWTKPKSGSRFASAANNFNNAKMVPTQLIPNSNSNQPFSAQFQHSPSLTKHITFSSPQQFDSPPPSPNLTPKIQQTPFSSNNQSNLFYGPSIAKKPNKAAEISFLELRESQSNQQSSQSQELRDVIDHNFLLSQYCSRTHSPLITTNHSMKNLNERREKKTVGFSHFSPQHSRQSSAEFGLLKQARSKLKRANTIQSIGSHSSQNSCIDVKFMQQMRGRRGVSRLLQVGV